jgi:hypothetical protein
MKFSEIAQILLVVFCMSGSASYAHEIQAHTDQKMYVHPSQIRFEREGLFIELLGALVGVTSIQHDVQGVYAVVSEIRSEDRDYCPNGHYSPRGNGKCNWFSCPFRE